MNFLRLIFYSFRTLKMHPLRSFLSTLGVFFGVIAVITIFAICEGSKHEILLQIEQLGLKNIILKKMEMTEEQKIQSILKKSEGLTINDLDQIKKNIPNIEKISALKIISANLHEDLNDLTPEILVVRPDYFFIKQLNLQRGRLISLLDCHQGSQVCVIGDVIAKTLGKNGEIGQTIKIANNTFLIIGILKSRKKSELPSTINEKDTDRSIFIPIGSEIGLGRKTPYADASLNEILIQVKNKEIIHQTLENIKRLLKKTHFSVEDYHVIVPEELLRQEKKAKNLLNLVLIIVTSLSMLTGGVGIMNIMLASIYERTREIGIRRAVGATKFHILQQFLVETLVLSLCGAILGIIFGIIISKSLQIVTGWPIYISLESIFLATALSLGVGILSGLYPSQKAADLDPIQALRNL
ncbi:Macrolide export ATP-binding/permease protein MacB [Candidatus Rubidus massiliensis]|nr:Macrolide export ATP-binding/permease protein MacB [Candidatus Rubidus massiliensis]